MPWYVLHAVGLVRSCLAYSNGVDSGDGEVRRDRGLFQGERLPWRDLSPAAQLELRQDLRLSNGASIGENAGFVLDSATGYYWYDALGTQSLTDIWTGKHASALTAAAGCISKAWTCLETCNARWFDGTTRVLWYCSCRYQCSAKAKVRHECPSTRWYSQLRRVCFGSSLPCWRRVRPCQARP